MTDENTAQGPLSVMDGVAKLRQSRADSLKAEPTVEEPREEAEQEQPEDHANAEIEAEAEPQTEAEEVEEDHPTEEVEEEASEAEGEEWYSIIDPRNGKPLEFTAEQIVQGLRAGMREADYTKSKQELSEEKARLATDRQQFDNERTQAMEVLQQQRVQLNEALTTFAIDQDPEPKAADFPDWKDFQAAKSQWDRRAEKRTEARQIHQAMQAEQHQATLQREFSALLGKKPEWRDQDAFGKAMEGLKETAVSYGYSPQEFEALSDHRMLLALHDLQQMRSAVDTTKAKQAATEKKVVRAVKQLTPSAKQRPDSAETKRVREAKSRFRKSGTLQDAARVLQASRRTG